MPEQSQLNIRNNVDDQRNVDGTFKSLASENGSITAPQKQIQQIIIITKKTLLVSEEIDFISRSRLLEFYLLVHRI